MLFIHTLRICGNYISFYIFQRIYRLLGVQLYVKYTNKWALKTILFWTYSISNRSTSSEILIIQSTFVKYWLWVDLPSGILFCISCVHNWLPNTHFHSKAQVHTHKHRNSHSIITCLSWLKFLSCPILTVIKS